MKAGERADLVWLVQALPPLPSPPFLSRPVGPLSRLQQAVLGLLAPRGFWEFLQPALPMGTLWRALGTGLQCSGSLLHPGGRGGFADSSKGEGLFLTPLTWVLAKNGAKNSLEAPKDAVRPHQPHEPLSCPRLCLVASSGPGTSGFESTKGGVPECRDAILHAVVAAWASMPDDASFPLQMKMGPSWT